MPFAAKGAVMFDLSGRIAFASTYFCELVGIEYEKIDGMSVFDFVYPEDMGEAMKRFELYKRPNAEAFRLRLRRMNGKPIWVDVQPAPMRVPHGDVYAVTATVTAAEPESIATPTAVQRRKSRAATLKRKKNLYASAAMSPNFLYTYHQSVT